MAIFDSTKEYIETIIKDNDNGDITADLLRSVLLNIVETTETSINNELAFGTGCIQEQHPHNRPCTHYDAHD